MLGRRKVGFRSLSEHIDTTTAGGRLVFHIMGSLAEFERTLIGERTRAGMAAARQRGVKVGRRAAMTEGKIQRARDLIGEGVKIPVVAKRLRVGKSTLYRSLSRESACKSENDS
jgi:DNA invertase Pin-like site-specific DNA recombinase